MADQVRTQVRVLVVDDEPDIRDAYRQILLAVSYTHLKADPKAVGAPAKARAGESWRAR